MTNIYKINLFTYDVKEEDCNHTTQDYKNYCLKNDILGWGWSRGKEAALVNTLDEYKEDYAKSYGKSHSLSIACNKIKYMQEGDYCWTYIDGNWYLGKIYGKFKFTAPDNYPAFGMLRGCKWRRIEDSDLVPGCISVYSINDRTVKHLDEKDDFVHYCELLYNNNKQKSLKLNFWHLVHYEDLEDIVGLYLQKEKNYLIFPSTNKTGTKDYEYKLVQKFNPYKNAIIQCKNNDNIEEEIWNKFESGEYKNLQIFILTIKEDIHPEKSNYEKCSNHIFKWSFDNNRINVFDSEKLKQWAIDNKNILPKRIQKFLDISE